MEFLAAGLEPGRKEGQDRTPVENGCRALPPKEVGRYISEYGDFGPSPVVERNIWYGGGHLKIVRK